MFLIVQNDKRRIEETAAAKLPRNDQPMDRGQNPKPLPNAKLQPTTRFQAPLDDSPIRRLRVPIRASDWPRAPVARRFCFTFGFLKHRPFEGPSTRNLPVFSAKRLRGQRVSYSLFFSRL